MPATIPREPRAPLRVLRAILQALRPSPCPYCGERVRVRLRYHVAVWH